MSVAEKTRRGPLHDEWAIRIKDRDHWKCWGCGMSRAEIEELGGKLEAAHFLPHEEYPDHRYLMENGRALCTFRNRRHPRGLGRGFGCHNAASGHWNGNHGFTNAVSGTNASHPRRYRMPKLTVPRAITAVLAVFAAAVLWGLHLPGWDALWGWGALGLSLTLWPELGLATALWVGLLALGFHSHQLHAPVTFGGYLGWLAALLGAWLACLGACTAVLGRLLRKVAR